MAAPRSVAVSAASSFTGLWIARAFEAAGWRVHALLTRPADAYTGLTAQRVARLPASETVGTAESGALAAWIRANRPTIWVHHHHFMEAFRAPNYDGTRADAVGLAPLPGLLDALRESGCAGIVHSGTFFEPGEAGNIPDGKRRATPYGESKLRVWEALAKAAPARCLRLAKMVIPNPIGPLENADRLIPVMIAKTRAGEPLEIRRPDAVSDYLPADTLGRRYVAAAERLLAGETGFALRPSGMVADVPTFVDTVQRELIVKRLGIPAVPPRIVPAADDGTAFVSFRNPAAEAEIVDWPAFWDWYAREGGA